MCVCEREPVWVEGDVCMEECVCVRARSSVWWMDKCKDECMEECVGGRLTLAYNRVKSKSSWAALQFYLYCIPPGS